MAEPFIDQLVDWGSFEAFVHDMYPEDDRLVVEHDVTDVGKYGARRQTDVKLTHKIGSLASRNADRMQTLEGEGEP